MIDNAYSQGNGRPVITVTRNQDFINADGILCCGRCGAEKEYKFVFAGRQKIVPCLCRCEQEKRDAEERARKRAEKERKIAEARGAGFPDKELQKYTFAADDRKNTRISDAMKRYVDNFPTFREKGQGLLLYGPVETGKTFMACCVANALIDNGYSCLATNFSRIANTVWSVSDKQGYYDKLNSYDLLVIDDLGAERTTSYLQELVYNIVDSRYRSGLPMIITTNLTREQLKHPGSVETERIYDRIMERCLPVEVDGQSRRKQKLRETADDMRNSLGL